ncbi:hypothetical protein LBW56_23430 [Ralstonia solanacearum]|uniref:hypothetical protein n=1 Tax=Ralstonia solanacearum TaxID=305 RepID=UPI002304FB4D|nr:hypothetical protein [Ralstonia solanacearum]MDB0529626.1 hypothetical protein [Ralstonia solanacearum]
MSNAKTAWGTIRATLGANFSFGYIKEIVGFAGLDMTALGHLRQTQGSGGATKDQLLSAVDQQLAKRSDAELRHVTAIVAEEMLSRNPQLHDALESKLGRHGWGLVDDQLIPLELFDPAELAELPAIPRADLVKAALRFRDGDLSGALSAACGAVNGAVAMVYQQHGLGDSTKASFQEGCNRAVQVVSDLEAPLCALGWDDATVKPFLQNFKGALNQGAYVMQTLRSKMGDVHGTKPILKSLVFDALKWSELFVRTLTVK